MKKSFERLIGVSYDEFHSKYFGEYYNGLYDEWHLDEDYDPVENDIEKVLKILAKDYGSWFFHTNINKQYQKNKKTLYFHFNRIKKFELENNLPKEYDEDF